MEPCNVFGLVGRTLGHSFSKAYFTEKFAREGVDACYLNFELDDIAALPRVLAEHPGLRGFNVTIPYKQAIIPLLDSLDDEARAIGAVNTVRVGTDGRLRGYNTDAPAFRDSLREMTGTSPMQRRALVAGTGGASMAVMHSLRLMGCEPTAVSRTSGKGRMTYGELTDAIVAEHGIVVNATPLGTSPHCDEAPPLPYGGLTPGHFCFDLVYNPDPTMFMRLCAARGATVRSGLDMLHRQAEGSWRIWNENEYTHL